MKARWTPVLWLAILNACRHCNQRIRTIVDLEDGMFKEVPRIEPTSLAKFVRQKMDELQLSQSVLCRNADFDQGLLSKVLRSMTINLGLQNALKLAIGLRVPPKTIFDLIDRKDLNDLLMSSCAWHQSHDQMDQGPSESR